MFEIICVYISFLAIAGVGFAANPLLPFPYSNQNIRAVSNNLIALNGAGQLSLNLSNILNTITPESTAITNFALDQMHPAQMSALVELQAELGGQIISQFHRLPVMRCSCSNANRFWIEPFGNTLTLKKHGMEIGAQSNSGGLSLGYDGEILKNVIFGIGGTWSQSRLHWHNHRGHAMINGVYGGLYADYQPSQFYFGASALGGIDFYETSRHIDFITTNRHARAKPMALDIMAQVAMAYLFGAPTAYFYPYANIDFLYLHTHKFGEHGAEGLDLTVRKRTDSTLRTEMGIALQVQDTNAAQTMCISPKFAIGWVNMSPIERERYKSTFKGAVIPFQTYGWNESWNLLHADVGLSISYYCCFFGAAYSVDVSPDSNTPLFNQYGQVELHWKW